MRHAIVDQNGLVVNVCIWNGNPWLPPKHHYVILAPGVDVGDSYDFEQEVFIKPSRVAKVPDMIIDAPLTLESLQAQLEELKAKLN